jgi:hypothetical protein
MSNMAFIHITQFNYLDLKGNIIDTTHGFRVVDDYDSSYSDFVAIEELKDRTAAEIFALAVQYSDDSGSNIINSARENNDGIFIADELFSWEQLLPATPADWRDKRGVN